MFYYFIFHVGYTVLEMALKNDLTMVNDEINKICSLLEIK